MTAQVTLVLAVEVVDCQAQTRLGIRLLYDTMVQRGVGVRCDYFVKNLRGCTADWVRGSSAAR